MTMYIWDLSAGYLGREQLAAEHDLLHRLAATLRDGSESAAGQMELLRWGGYQPVFYLRHQLLMAEMELRGDRHNTPFDQEGEESVWPVQYLQSPGKQFELLGEEVGGGDARIPLPGNAQQLWAQHKYSVMARDANLYRALGPGVAQGRWHDDFAGLAQLLVDALRQPPAIGQLRNALQHMWGHVSSGGEAMPKSDGALMRRIQQKAYEQQERYLLESTALSELAIWTGEG